MLDSCALVDSNIILGHSNEFMKGTEDTPEYLKMLGNFNTLFYAEPTYKEVFDGEVAKAKRNGESLSQQRLLTRTKRRLYPFIELPQTEVSQKIAFEIERRLSFSCLESSEILRMATDINITAIGIYHLKQKTKVVCISDNIDFLYIECAVPEDIEVWTAKRRRRKSARHCRRIIDSMIKLDIDLSSVVYF